MIQTQSLRYFAEVARTGSLRQAAETFHIAPSAISRQIANLEAECGAALFTRSSRGMMLTEAGAVLLSYARENDSRLERLHAELDAVSGLRRGTVRLAVVEALTSQLLPDLLASFRSQHPGIAFRVAVCGTHEVAERIATDEAELGMPFDTLARDDLILQGRIPQPLQMIVRPDHPLADRRPIRIEEAADFPAALPTTRFGIRYRIDQAAARAGLRLSCAWETDSLALIKAIVRRTSAVSFMPPLTFAPEVAAGELTGVALDDADSARASIDVVSARDRPLALPARAFVEHMRAQGVLRGAGSSAAF
jgi:DNA-binding transcriptional LysR family regulator